MTIGVRTADKVTVVDVSGEVDLHHSPELLAKLTELIKQNHKSILLNFQGVTYIDSSGLASLIGAFQQLRPQGGQLRLANLSKPVQSVFAVARLDKVFTIHPTEAEAVQALGAM
jgi:anti-sigma B factor antagonist